MRCCPRCSRWRARSRPHVLGMRPFDVQMAAAWRCTAAGSCSSPPAKARRWSPRLPPCSAHSRAAECMSSPPTTTSHAGTRSGWRRSIAPSVSSAAFVIEGLSRDARRRAYACDITYVTAKEAGFDFLRDHTAESPLEVVHRGHEFAIVDEADFILIDEARVPLVIASDAPSPDVNPVALAAVVRRLRAGVDYTADEYARTVVLTEAGFRQAGTLVHARLDEQSNHLLLSAVHVALHAESAAPPRPRLRRAGRPRRDRGRMDRPGRGQPPLAERHPAGGRSQGRRHRSSGRGAILGSIPMQHFVSVYQPSPG